MTSTTITPLVGIFTYDITWATKNQMTPIDEIPYVVVIVDDSISG